GASILTLEIPARHCTSSMPSLKMTSSITLSTFTTSMSAVRLSKSSRDSSKAPSGLEPYGYPTHFHRPRIPHGRAESGGVRLTVEASQRHGQDSRVRLSYPLDASLCGRLAPLTLCSRLGVFGSVIRGLP